MIKVQFRETNKKTNVGSLKTFQQFTDKVNKSFRDLPQELVYYYFDEDGDRIQIENQEDFQNYKSEQRLPKIYVKGQEDDFVDSSNQSVIINSQILTKSLKQQNSQIKQQSSGSFKKENKTEKVYVKTEKQEIVQKINNTIHKNIKCVHCKADVIGIRWKCLDEFDTDVCNRCYQSKTHKEGHYLLKIQTQDYLSRINYYDSIYRLFNPNYEIDKSSNKVKPWIKEEDILQSNPQAVKEIWNASKHIAQKVANEYADWQRQWQRLNKKDDRQLIKK